MILFRDTKRVEMAQVAQSNSSRVCHSNWISDGRLRLNLPTIIAILLDRWPP